MECNGVWMYLHVFVGQRKIWSHI